MRMPKQIVVVLVCLIPCLAIAHDSSKLIFAGMEGKEITLDIAQKTLVGPTGQISSLQDCSDQKQICFTNGADFSISLYRACVDQIVAQGRGLSFQRKTVWALHGDSWFFYDEAPQYLFQDRENLGIIAIYTGAKVPFDFRTALVDSTLNSESALFKRYDLISGGPFGACKD